MTTFNFCDDFHGYTCVTMILEAFRDDFDKGLPVITRIYIGKKHDLCWRAVYFTENRPYKVIHNKCTFDMLPDAPRVKEILDMVAQLKALK